MDDAASIDVRNNQRELRYEAWVDGTLAGEIRYRTQPGAVVLVHTEIAPQLEGQSVASTLVQGALDDIRAHDLRVVPICPFVAAYIKRHSQYTDLIVDDDATPE